MIKLENQSRTVKYRQNFSLCLGKLNNLISVGARSHEWFLDNNWNMWLDFESKKGRSHVSPLPCFPDLSAFSIKSR